MGTVVNGLTHAWTCVLVGRFVAAGGARATDGAAAAGGVLDTDGPIITDYDPFPFVSTQFISLQ